MKQMGKDMVLSLIVGFLLPGILLNFGTSVFQRTEPSPLETPALQETLPVQTVLPVKLRMEDTAVLQTGMDDYLVGVVLAEMPVSFETEALKAQSVVARTYARKAYTTGGKHGDGSVCTKSTCCQGYVEPRIWLEQGGSEEGLAKIRMAVSATSGQVLTYEDALIEATYFSCSGGRTEPALAVWGTDYPYLQAVDSPGEEAAAHYTDTAEFTPRQLEQALGVSLEGNPEAWFGNVRYTAGGGVDTMEIAGKEFSGTHLRAALGLRSAAFTVTAEQEMIRITTRGYGHRVGMSQYGADAMAAEGSRYDDILAHYYPGTVLTKLAGEEMTP